MSVHRTGPPSCQDGVVADSLDAPLRLVVGDEELLVYAYGTPPETEHAEILDSAL